MKKEPSRKSELREDNTEPDSLSGYETDADFSEDLLKALHQVDRAAPQTEPGLPRMLNLVRRTKGMERQRMIRDLAFFLATAFVTVAVEVFSLVMRPQVFVTVLGAVSALSLAITPVILVLHRRSRGDLE